MGRGTCGALALCLALLMPGVCRATIYFEVGDSGDLMGTAQAVGASVDQISGCINPLGDCDLYCLQLPGGAFFASTVGGSSVDTQLYLFDSIGMGIVGNDDAAGDGLQSRVDANLAGGTYYLGISAFNYDPISAGGWIFPDTVDYGGDPLWGPTGPGGGQPLTGWQQHTGSVTQGTGPYIITMSTTVPEPASLAMLMLGGAVLVRRRRK